MSKMDEKFVYLVIKQDSVKSTTEIDDKVFVDLFDAQYEMDSRILNYELPLTSIYNILKLKVIPKDTDY